MNEEERFLKQEKDTVRRIAKTGRSCGQCNLCCKVLSIDVEGFHKAANQWCQHAKAKRGCGIYASRPSVCRSWACSWLMDKSIQDHWYPPISKMVVNQAEDVNGAATINIAVDPGHPGAWRREPWYSDIKQISATGLGDGTVVPQWKTVVRVGGKSWIVLPDEDVEWDHGPCTLLPQPDGSWGVVQGFRSAEELERFMERMSVLRTRIQSLPLSERLQMLKEMEAKAAALGDQDGIGKARRYQRAIIEDELGRS